MSTIHSTTFKNDGYCDALEYREPAPPDIRVYASEYMEGYKEGYHDRLKDEYLNMEDDEILKELREQLRQFMTRMADGYQFLASDDEKNRINALLSIADRR